VPGVVFATRAFFPASAEDRSLQQVANVAALPGIGEASYAMPDIHWGMASRSAGWPRPPPPPGRPNPGHPPPAHASLSHQDRAPHTPAATAAACRNQQDAQKTTGQAHTAPGAAATTATPQGRIRNVRPKSENRSLAGQAAAPGGAQRSRVG